MASSVDQLAAQVTKLEERLSSVEKSALPPDAIAVPSILIVNEDGVVEEPEYAEIEEEGEEEEPEEGELLEASGKGRRKYRRLGKGKAGQVLKVGADGTLEWGEAEGGGGGGGGGAVIAARVAANGEVLESKGESFQCELETGSAGETHTAAYELKWWAELGLFKGSPVLAVLPEIRLSELNEIDPDYKQNAITPIVEEEWEYGGWHRLKLIFAAYKVGAEEKCVGIEVPFSFLAFDTGA